jgi:hypothetical protein
MRRAAAPRADVENGRQRRQLARVSLLDLVGSYPDRINLEFSGGCGSGKAGRRGTSYRSGTEVRAAGSDFRVRDLWLGHDSGHGAGRRNRGKTSPFPKDGRHIVPVKDAVWQAEGLEVGDMVTVHMAVDV